MVNKSMPSWLGLVTAMRRLETKAIKLKLNEIGLRKHSTS